MDDHLGSKHGFDRGFLNKLPLNWPVGPATARNGSKPPASSQPPAIPSPPPPLRLFRHDYSTPPAGSIP